MRYNFSCRKISIFYHLISLFRDRIQHRYSHHKGNSDKQNMHFPRHSKWTQIIALIALKSSLIELDYCMKQYESISQILAICMHLLFTRSLLYFVPTRSRTKIFTTCWRHPSIKHAFFALILVSQDGFLFYGSLNVISITGFCCTKEDIFILLIILHIFCISPGFTIAICFRPSSLTILHF